MNHLTDILEAHLVLATTSTQLHWPDYGEMDKIKSKLDQNQAMVIILVCCRQLWVLSLCSVLPVVTINSKKETLKAGFLMFFKKN